MEIKLKKVFLLSFVGFCYFATTFWNSYSCCDVHVLLKTHVMTAIHTRQYVYYKSAKNYRILQLYSTAVKQCQLKTIFDHWDRTVTLAVMYLEIKPQKKKKLFVFAPFQCAAVNLKPWKARSGLISNKFLSSSLKVLSFSEGRLKTCYRGSTWIEL